MAHAAHRQGLNPVAHHTFMLGLCAPQAFHLDFISTDHQICCQREDRPPGTRVCARQAAAKGAGREDPSVAYARAPESLAAVTVTAVLMAGALTKLGYGWSGISLITALCLAGGIIEHLTAGRKGERRPTHELLQRDRSRHASPGARGVRRDRRASASGRGRSGPRVCQRHGPR